MVKTCKFKSYNIIIKIADYGKDYFDTTYRDSYGYPPTVKGVIERMV